MIHQWVKRMTIEVYFFSSPHIMEQYYLNYGNHELNLILKKFEVYYNILKAVNKERRHLRIS
jgi:hypothetical protein